MTMHPWARMVLMRLILSMLVLAWGWPLLAADSSGDGGDSMFQWGLNGGFGYFNFRNSLFVDREPDPPGNLSDDWFEFSIKPRLSFSREAGPGEWFGDLSWVYARTDDDASEIAGGGADSADFDDMYLGWRMEKDHLGSLQLAGGRYPFQIAHGLLLSDGYADGGSRGALWTNPRVAWAPAAHVQFLRNGHELDLFYLERDERPESDSDTRIAGVNYEWLSVDKRWTLGASVFKLKANDLASQRDGADVWNLRLYSIPLTVPLTVEAEWAHEDNGPALDAVAWYVQPFWAWEDSWWKPVLFYRYAYFEGDDPDTPANEDFDPLFPAFHDWGSWWQGEIAGEYFLSNSNLKSHMLRLHTQPRDTIETGLILFDYSLDQPGSFQGGVRSDDLGWEANWYMDWRVNARFTLSFVLARNQPGKAVEEAFNRTKPFRYAMMFVSFSL